MRDLPFLTRECDSHSSAMHSQKYTQYQHQHQRQDKYQHKTTHNNAQHYSLTNVNMGHRDRGLALLSQELQQRLEGSQRGGVHHHTAVVSLQALLHLGDI